MSELYILLFYSHFTVYYVAIDIAPPCSYGIHFICAGLQKSFMLENPLAIICSHAAFKGFIKDFGKTLLKTFMYNAL